MSSFTQHQPIGFLPLSFSFSDHQISPGFSSDSGSVNDLLDLMEEDDEGEDCDRNARNEDVTNRAFIIDNQMNVKLSEIRATDNFSSKEQRSHVNTFGNSAQLSSLSSFDVDNDEGETTRITNTRHGRGQSTQAVSLN